MMVVLYIYIYIYGMQYNGKFNILFILYKVWGEIMVNFVYYRFSLLMI